MLTILSGKSSTLFFSRFFQLSVSYGPRIDSSLLAIHRIKHRRRTSPPQLKILEHHFDLNPKPDVTTRKALSEQLDMTPREVQVWVRRNSFASRFVPTVAHILLFCRTSFKTVERKSRNSRNAPIVPEVRLLGMATLHQIHSMTRNLSITSPLHPLLYPILRTSSLLNPILLAQSTDKTLSLSRDQARQQLRRLTLRCLTLKPVLRCYQLNLLITSLPPTRRCLTLTALQALTSQPCTRPL